MGSRIFLKYRAAQTMGNVKREEKVIGDKYGNFIIRFTWRETKKGKDFIKSTV